MFDFKEELKNFEPGLESVEATLSGDIDKDLVELMQVFLKARPDPLAAKTEEAETPETTESELEQKEPTEA